MLLGVVPQTQAVAGQHFTRVGLLQAGENPKQGGLSGTVQSEHHHLAALVDGKIDSGEHLE